MKCYFEKIRSNKFLRSAFSLVEAMAALIILGIVSVSVLVVINRSMASAADSLLKMQAFEVARENMETLLASESVSEEVEYGTSEKYPGIKWQTTVDVFYEPTISRAWIQGTCTGEYVDTSGSEQKVELTHWLTEVSEKELIAMVEKRWKEQGGPTDGNNVRVPDSNEPNKVSQKPKNQVKGQPKDSSSWQPDDWDEMTKSQRIKWLINELKG